MIGLFTLLRLTCYSQGVDSVAEIIDSDVETLTRTLYNESTHNRLHRNFPTDLEDSPVRF